MSFGIVANSIFLNSGLLTATGNSLYVNGSSITAGSIIRYAGFTVDGGSTVLTTGLKGYDTIPFGGTIVNWSIDASPSGSVAFDIYKIGSGLNPPTASIVGGMPPSLVNGYFQDVTGLAGWSTTVTGGDRVGWVVRSVSLATKASFKLGIQT